MYQYKRVSPSNTKNSDRPARWKILTNWKEFRTVRQYLILKWVYSELTYQEYQLLVDTVNPSYDMFVIVNKLFFELKSKKKIQKILNIYYSDFSNEEIYNKSVYQLLDAEAKRSLKLEVFYTERRKGKKYSGWRRNHNDKGTLGPQVSRKFEKLVPLEEENLEQRMFKTLLSVLDSQNPSE